MMNKISGIDNKILSQLHTPCYVFEEKLLKENLEIIRKVGDEAGVEIILALKAFALWKTFPFFGSIFTQLLPVH